MNLRKKLGYITTAIASIFSMTIFALSVHSKSVTINTDSETKETLEKSISANFQEIPLEALLKIIADYSGLENVIVPAEISKQEVVINVERIPVSQLFRLMSETYNLNVIVDGKNLKVTENVGGFKKSQTLSFANSQPEIGALIDFSIEINSPAKKDALNTVNSKFTVWSNFDKQSFIKINDKLQLSLHIKDVDDKVLFDMKIIEDNSSHEMTILAEPRLMSNYNKEAIVEFENEQAQKRIKLILNAQKQEKPRAS